MQRRFVNEYCVDENGTQAAIRAGCSETSAHVTACRWLKMDKIKKAIAERMEECALAASITPEWVVAQWAKIARADPNDVVHVRRTCCRHCHGVGHQYQWTEAEYAAAAERADTIGAPTPDSMGGFGYNPQAAPHQECPECGGQGVEVVHVADSRKSKSPLYAGAERTRHGIKVTMVDQQKALDNLARYLGILPDKKEISGPGGGAIPLTNLTADVPAADLAKIYKELMG